MSAFTLNLKKRPSGMVLNIPVEIIEETMKDGDKNNLWELFKPLIEKNAAIVHDKRWLELIVNWTPKDGLPMTEGARWLKLAVRVGNLDDKVEGNFTLSQDHVNQIWDRVTNPDFTVRNLSPAWAAFVLDFQKVTGKHFTKEDDSEEIGDQ